MSDNGPPFNSERVEEFCKDRGINLKHSPAYHPQSNGLAERFVQTMKTKIKKEYDIKTIKCLAKLQERIDEIVHQLNNTPVVNVHQIWCLSLLQGTNL